jgi:hypothetical protein
MSTHFSNPGAVIAVSLLAMLATAGCKRTTAVRSVPPSDPRIVGTWTLAGGDYPLTDEYRADGTLVQHVGNRTTEPTPFRIEGEYLVVTLAQPDGRSTEQKTRFALSGDTLTMIDAPTVKRVFRRNPK